MLSSASCGRSLDELLKNEPHDPSDQADNVTALTALVKMRPKTPAIGIIVRELAIQLAEQSVPPDALQTPGISHVVADALSRVFSPEGGGVVDASIHPALASATLSAPPERSPQWYKAHSRTRSQWGALQVRRRWTQKIH